MEASQEEWGVSLKPHKSVQSLVATMLYKGGHMLASVAMEAASVVGVASLAERRRAPTVSTILFVVATLDWRGREGNEGREGGWGEFTYR